MVFFLYLKLFFASAMPCFLLPFSNSEFFFTQVLKSFQYIVLICVYTLFIVHVEEFIFVGSPKYVVIGGY